MNRKRHATTLVSRNTLLVTHFVYISPTTISTKRVSAAAAPCSSCIFHIRFPTINSCCCTAARLDMRGVITSRLPYSGTARREVHAISNRF